MDVELYVCVWDGMHVQYISTICAPLTLLTALMSAPLSKSKEHIGVWPFSAA